MRPFFDLCAQKHGILEFLAVIAQKKKKINFLNHHYAAQEKKAKIRRTSNLFLPLQKKFRQRFERHSFAFENF